MGRMRFHKMIYEFCQLVCSIFCLTVFMISTATAQQSDVRLQVQIENGKTQFQMGEIIPLKLSFTSSTPKKYQINLATYDRSGRMNYEKFMVEPESGWSDPLKAYFASGTFLGGGLTNFKFLSQE